MPGVRVHRQRLQRLRGPDGDAVLVGGGEPVQRVCRRYRPGVRAVTFTEAFDVAVVAGARGRPMRRDAWPQGVWLAFAASAVAPHDLRPLLLVPVPNQKPKCYQMPYAINFTDLAAQDWTTT